MPENQTRAGKAKTHQALFTRFLTVPGLHFSGWKTRHDEPKTDNTQVRNSSHMPARTDILRKYASEQRHLTAVHEAGHAAVLWFFQIPAITGIHLELEDDLLHSFTNEQPIGMDGEVRTNLGSLNLQMHLDTYDMITTRQYCKFNMIFTMGGSIAEAKFGGDFVDTCIDYNWFYQMREDYDVWGEEDDHSDYISILASAQLAYPENPRLARSAVRTAARWANELFAIPLIEIVVRSLADEILRQETRYFGGDVVWDRMSLAWNNQKFPIRQNRWRRRFAKLLGLEEVKRIRRVN